RMPFQPVSFDRVFCFGVLQHTPDVRLAFQRLLEMLRSGGFIALDVYLKRSGLRGLLSTKRWVRPLARRISPAVLYRLTTAYLRIMWPVTALINRIPRYGRAISWQLLVADYRGAIPLSDALLKEWAILDTFDMLSPRFDQPQTLETIS